MLEVNDDMDELFRRAAEGYPLKTSTPDFEKVLDSLEAAKRIEPSNEKKDRKKFLWFFMLIPLSIVATTFIDKRTGSSGPLKTRSENVERTASAPFSNENDITAAAPIHREEAIETAKMPSAAEAEIEPVSPRKGNRVVVANPASSDIVVTTTKLRINSKRSWTTAANEKPLTNNLNPNKAGQRETYNNSKTGSNENLPLVETNKVLDKNGVTDETIDAKTQPAEAVNAQAADQPATGDASPTPVTSTDVNVSKTLPKSTKPPPIKRWYVGIIAAPDISNVKSSSFSKVGVSAGVLVGFDINKSVSVESGVLWAKRFYKSDGKYFDVKKTRVPAYVKILDLNGYCQMYEIPLNIRYNPTVLKRGSLNIVAGVSSYIMKREDYNYNVYNNGQTYYRYVDYRNSGNNWMATLNLGAGLQKPLGKTIDLRVEPYIKIPLQGAGIGSLPITSYGLYFGLTKHIF